MYRLFLPTVKYQKYSIPDNLFLHAKTVVFLTIQFSISTKLKCQNTSISNNYV